MDNNKPIITNILYKILPKVFFISDTSSINIYLKDYIILYNLLYDNQFDKDYIKVFNNPKFHEHYSNIKLTDKQTLALIHELADYEGPNSDQFNKYISKKYHLSYVSELIDN